VHLATEAEFKEWLLHPVTQQVRQMLEAKREELRRQWEGGAFTDYALEAVALVNVGNLGTCKGYAFVAELDYEQFIAESEDGKSVGA
tara:strand:- start:810 stop:1070 length:261 start_codon:yes stop_codon:yes gene_type:complete